MAAKIYYDQDADLGLLKGRKIAIIGYGSQGHAHALNLKDSGQDVVVGLYKGSKSWAKAEADGCRVTTVNEAAQAAQIIMILLPDQSQRQVYEESIKGALGKGKTLMFAHGFNIHFNQVVPSPDVDVTATTYTLEVTGEETKIDAIIELLRPFGIQELVRTGKVAIARGPKTRLRKVEEKLGKPKSAAPAQPQDPRVVGFAD